MTTSGDIHHSGSTSTKRITSFDPQVSAAVFSERRTAEEGFESGVATGLARALGEREDGIRRAGAGAMAAQQAISFWDSEVARLDELGAKIPPGKTGFHDLAMKEHLARRTATIARLKEADPEQAEIFDLRTRPLVETLERRASAMESEAAGRTLSAGVGGALVMAVRAVRADPLQHDALRDGLADTLSEMERDGVDAEALARVRASADRSLAMAAIGGLIDSGQFDEARELLSEGRMPALNPEDRREQERLVGRAERRAEATGLAELAAARDTYWAGYRSLEARLREGGEAPDLRYTDDSIRAALPQAQAEKMIALRDEAEDTGDAYGRVALASPDTIDTLIAEAGPEEARHLRAAARERERRLAEDPAAYALGNARVQAAEGAWRAALEGDDPDAIARAARAYAEASLNEQRRLGVADAERRVLPAGSAAGMVTAFTGGERPDPAGLGAELRERLGEHWRPVLEELTAAGLPEGMAAIAAMDRPDQQAAAQRFSTLVGISTTELWGRIDEADFEVVERTLRAVVPELASSAAANPEVSAQAALLQRRAIDLIAAGEGPASAVVMAAAEVLAKSPADAAKFRRAARQRLAAMPKPPADQPAPNVIDAALPPSSEVDRSLAMSEEIRVLAERLGLNPESLPPDSERLRGLLLRLDGFDSLSPEEQRQIDLDIRAFQNRPPQFWVPIREKYSELWRAARSRAAELENARTNPDESRLIPIFREYMKIEPADRASMQRLLFSRIPHSLIRPEGGSSDNIAWLERALLGNDQDQREFAAAYLEFTGSAIHVEELENPLDEPLQNVLSPPALEAYLRYWHVPFEREFPLQEDFGSLWSQRTADTAEFLTREWPVPDDVAISLVEALQRSMHASKDGAEALLTHIDRVVAPLNRELADGMRTAVEILRANRESIETIPGRYAFLLSDRDLLDLGDALGLLNHDFRLEIDVPPDLLEHIGWLTPAGAAVAVGSVAEAAVAGALATSTGGALAAAGLVVAGADLYEAIDDHNQIHSAYLIRREIQMRLTDLRTFEDIVADENGQVGTGIPSNETSQDTKESEDNRIRFNEPFRLLLNERRNFHDPSTSPIVNPSGLLP